MLYSARWPLFSITLVSLGFSAWYHGIEPARHVSAADLDSEIRQLLQRQAGAWNNGDIEAFMQDYWKSESLTFSSDGETRRGWQTTFDRYRKRYPTREKMGQLTFSNLEINQLGETAAWVLGRWHLKRKTDELGGNFTLILRKLDGKWVIVHDHTSSDPEKTSDSP